MYRVNKRINRTARIAGSIRKNKNMNAASNLFGDELLNAIFANFKALKFKTTESELMSIFFDLLSKPKFRLLAVEYPFDLDGPEPRSKALSDAFDSLQQSRLIGRMNPDLVVYEIGKSMQVRYEKFIKPKLNGAQNLVVDLANEVERRLEVVK